MKKSSNPQQPTSAFDPAEDRQPSQASQIVQGPQTSQESQTTSPRDERFLSRWSRLKRAQSQSSASTISLSDPAPTPGAALGTINQPTPNGDIPPLPSIDSLTADSDYAQFFQPKVPEALRRAAVKKLFADPHFNKMDGLDTYIGDYTKFEPIPESLLKSLVQARDIIDHPSNWKVEAVEAATDGVEAAPPEVGANAVVADDGVDAETVEAELALGKSDATTTAVEGLSTCEGGAGTTDSKSRRQLTSR